jgi:membrane protease YdiL (CAAX protease family)
MIYVAMVGPSLLLAGETKRRFLDLKMGAKALAYLPLTVLPLLIFTIFAVNFLSEIPVLNASWLGYNIAIGPFGDQGLFGIVPFLPPLVYMLIHVNYFEEVYFRKDVKRVIIWALLHIAMGVTIYVALALLPLGFFYKFIRNKYDVNHAYTLHLATNLVLIMISLTAYVFL